MNRFVPIIIFLLVLAAAGSLAITIEMSERHADQLKFESLADEATQAVEGRIAQHFSILTATRAMFRASSADVDRPAFAKFVDDLNLENLHRGVQGIGFARMIPVGQEEVAETQIARNYGREFKVYPPTTEDFRFPIVLLEPFNDRNAQAVGYDMFAEPVRRAAMRQAIAEDNHVATGAVVLRQENGEDPQNGFLVYLPVYVDPLTAGDSNAPWRVRGFVYEAFRAGDLFDAALQRPLLLPVSVEAFDGPDADAPLLYSSSARVQPEGGRIATVTRNIVVGGRTWHLRMRPTTAFSPRTPGVTAGLVAIVGLLLAGSLALLARIQAEAIATASKLAEVNAQSLADKELLLQEMKHRIKNSISRILAMARHTARSAESTEGFIRSFSDRLEAMARSQDMLTRSRWEQIPLRDLLTAELEQVFGSQMDQCELEGPRVMLQPGHAQALGLTFHELATNALKYGSISEAEGRLDVGWKMTGGHNSPELELVWEEIGVSEITAPSGTGFGSQLIRANLEGELGGRLDVQFAEKGVRVEMRVPFAPPEPAPRRRRGKKGQGKSAAGRDKAEVRPESAG